MTQSGSPMRTHGMADAGRDEVGGRVLRAWDAFLEQAVAVDLDRSTRLPGWRGSSGSRASARRPG